MTPAFSIDRHGDVVVAHLPTDVDAANANRVGEGLMSATDSAVPALILDLGETRYLDSAGLDMVFRLAERLQARRQRLHLVAADDAPLMRILNIAAITEVVPVHGDLAAALDAVRGPEGKTVRSV